MGLAHARNGVYIKNDGQLACRRLVVGIPGETDVADLFLKRRILGDRDYLPDICVVCGQPDAQSRKVTLYYQPYFWLEFLSQSRLNVLRLQSTWLPLCPAHRKYFGSLNLYALTGLLGIGLILLVILGSVVTLAVVGKYHGTIACGGFLAVLVTVVAVFTTRGVVRLRQVRPTRIDDDGVHLVNVAPELVEALAERQVRPYSDFDDGELRPASKLPMLMLLAGGAVALILLAGCGVTGFLVTSNMSWRSNSPTQSL